MNKSDKTRPTPRRSARNVLYYPYITSAVGRLCRAHGPNENGIGKETIMEKIWITGANGHVGTALCKLLDCTSYEILATDEREVDITDRESVASYVRVSRPDIIVNCAGFADREACEQNPDRAYSVNALGVRNLAVQAQAIGAKLIHLSSDDVFSRAACEPYNEFDTPAPTSVYGRSKLAGEQFVQTLCTRFVIVRSSWVYGIGQDFVNTVISAADDENCPWLMVPTDSTASPTSAAALAAAIQRFIEQDCLGIYHVVCGGSCNRLDFAKEILRCAGKTDKLELRPTHSGDYETEYSVLDNMMLRLDGIPQPGDWRTTLAEYIAETGGNV